MLSSLNGVTGFKIDGEMMGDISGSSVSSGPVISTVMVMRIYLLVLKVMPITRAVVISCFWRSQCRK